MKESKSKIEAKKDKFLKDLAETGFISFSAKRTGIGRSSVYRWMDLDPVFSTQCQDAIRKSRMHLNDVAEAALISRVKEGHVPAIRYWLDNNHRLYRENRLRWRGYLPTFMDKIKSYF